MPWLKLVQKGANKGEVIQCIYLNLDLTTYSLSAYLCELTKIRISQTFQKHFIAVNALDNRCSTAGFDTNYAEYNS